MPPTTTTKRMPLEIERLPVRFDNDDGRVIARLFTPGGEMRIRKVIQRIGRLGENDIDRLLADVMQKFRHRHGEIEKIFLDHYETVVRMVGRPIGLSENRKLLIGSYFTMEYSFESAALFNPSIVPSKLQCSVDRESVRFLMSLRATGEGHISSLVFRTGTITADGVVEVDPPSRISHAAKISHDRLYHREVFRRKLH
ncbi:MAG: glycosidase, partial [Desulfobacterales bacterium]|nr:glycosidase [Desulfobacterales bacterium]